MNVINVDLKGLQSIYLGLGSLCGDKDTYEKNILALKSMHALRD